MASYQDIDTRLSVVEEKIDWVMKQFKMEKRTQLGTLNSAGQPQIKIETQTLLDIYRELKNGSLEQINGI